jgi:hypothetical protein
MPISQIVTNSIAANAVATVDIADLAVTPVKMSQKLTSDTAKTSTSGTSIDFTGIPSWVKRVTVMFSQMSTNGSSIVQIQLGSTTFSTSGYAVTASYGTTASSAYAYATTGFILEPSGAAQAGIFRSGFCQFNLINSNTWVGSGNTGSTTALLTSSVAGNSPNLSGALDRIRITTVNGTDAFDSGTINILYE